MEEDDPYPVYEEVQKKHQPIFRRDRHLASALHNGETENMLRNRENPAGLKREHKELLADLGDAFILPSSQYIHWALLHVSKHGTKGRLDLKTHIQVANNTTRISLQDYAKIDFDSLTGNPPPLIAQVYRLKQYLHTIVQEITFSHEFTQEYDFFNTKAKCYGNLHLVWVSDRFVFIVAHSYFLAVRDCINAWFSLLSYGLINPAKYPGYNLYNEIANVIYAVQHDLGIYRDETYAILKAWQPLVTGKILEGLESNNQFLLSLQDVVDQHPHSMLLKIILRPIVTEIDAHLQLELTGLTKCFGHPEILMDASVATWIDKGTILKTGQEEIAEDIRRAFILEFSRNYYKQHRKWPNLKFAPDADPFIVQSHKMNMWLETMDVPWVPEMFSGVSMGKTLSFDYQVYTADLLADKSIIPSLNHWVYEYDIQAHRTNHGFFPTKPPREGNNAIIHYMKQPEVNVRDIIEYISQNNAKPQWRVTVAVAKEREMKKNKARMFWEADARNEAFPSCY